jgi:outer membrane protein TolC
MPLTFNKLNPIFVVLPLLFTGLLGAQQEPPIASTSPVGVTLKQVYEQALEHNERISISEQLIRQAEGLYRQTLGFSFPGFSFLHDTQWHDRSGASIQSPQHEGRFNAGIFGLTGYRELAAVKAGKSAIHLQQRALERAQQLLLSDVAIAFYGLLQAEENVRSTSSLVELARKRLAELSERVRVGRSREVEAVGQDFQITALQSQLEETQRQVAARRDLLGFLANTPIGVTQASDVTLPLTPASLETYLARIDTRPDVEAATEAIDIAQALTRIARSEYLPKLDLSANAYLYRPDARENVDWDAGLGVRVPIWAWGARRGLVQASLAGLQIREQEWNATRRQADIEIRDAYRNLLSAKRQMEFQQKAVGLARRDYEYQVRDDRRGLVTSLEVLESLNRLNSAELAYNNAQLAHRLTAINLEIMSGAKPEEILR